MTEAAYYPALTAAIDTNKAIVMDALRKQGSWARWYLKFLCEEQGYADDLSFDGAITELVNEGKVAVSGENVVLQ